MKPRLTKEEFIEKAKKVHKDIDYDYSEVVYVNNHTPVKIIDPEFGPFEQTPMKHLSGHDSPARRYIKISKRLSLTKEQFINKAILIHGNKYDYSEVDYLNYFTKVKIICHNKDEHGVEHGEFWQIPANHINKNHPKGCHKCGGSDKLSTEEFIEKAKEVHGDKYDYSKSEYINHMTKVCIICHQKDCYGNEHGEFWQIPNSHLKGCGCPKCNNLKRVRYIEHLLIKNNINYTLEKSFEWLRNKGLLRLDFYLDDYNIAIEHQGPQHFKPTRFWHNDNVLALKQFKENQIRDKVKKELCEKHNIQIYYINYNENIKEKIKKLLNELNKNE